jgi:hypothetical protein
MKSSLMPLQALRIFDGTVVDLFYKRGKMGIRSAKKEHTKYVQSTFSTATDSGSDVYLTASKNQIAKHPDAMPLLLLQVESKTMCIVCTVPCLGCIAHSIAYCGIGSNFLPFECEFRNKGEMKIVSNRWLHGRYGVNINQGQDEITSVLSGPCRTIASWLWSVGHSIRLLLFFYVFFFHGVREK